MYKFLIILLIPFVTSAFVATKEGNVIFQKETNEKTKINLSQNKFKNNIEEYEFIQWKCYKSQWLMKYKELILTVGYFTEFKKFNQNNRIGMLLLNKTKSKKLTVYSKQGVQHYWNWGGTNYNNLQLIIHPSGNGWLYDFENKKLNEEQSPKESYDCKPSITSFITIDDMKNIMNELNYVRNFERKNFRDILKTHIQKCFKSNFPNTTVLKNYPKVTLQIFTDKDGVIYKTNVLNKAKYKNNFEYKMVADIASKAVMRCSLLPISKNKISLFKSIIIDFDPKFSMVR